MADTEHIGQLLKRLREERGLSKKRLARESLISDAYLVQIEQGKRTPSEKVLRRLATALQMPPWQLLEPAGVYSAETIASAKHWWGLNIEGVDPASYTPEDAAMGYGATLEQQSGSPMADPDYLMRLDHPEAFEPQHQLGFQPSPEGWAELSSKDMRLVQQLINRLRYVDTEGE